MQGIPYWLVVPRKCCIALWMIPAGCLMNSVIKYTYHLYLSDTSATLKHHISSFRIWWRVVVKQSVLISVVQAVLHFGAIYLNPFNHFLLNFSIGIWTEGIGCSRIEGNVTVLSVARGSKACPLLDRLDTGTHDDMFYEYFISCKVRNQLFIVVSGLMPSRSEQIYFHNITPLELTKLASLQNFLATSPANLDPLLIIPWPASYILVARLLLIFLSLNS